MPVYSTMSLPVAFTVNNKNEVVFGQLQQKMMDLGWELFVDDKTKTTYFMHKTYGQRKYNAHTLKTGKTTYIFPIISQSEDPKGLGCSFQCTGSGCGEIVSNEWTSYWDTRIGRRREKYLKYLAAREETRNEIEEEAKKSQYHKVKNTM
jgi:hypothetical protein